jgi:hypothetical protein
MTMLRLRLLLGGLALLASSCRAPDSTPEAPVSQAPPPAAAPAAAPAVAPAAAAGSPFILPPTVVPVSSEIANFGIDTARLSPREAAVVESAWRNFERVLAGKRPECPVAFGVSDGGSAMYDCGSYDLMRVRSLTGDVPEFEYGPELDFRNGHHVERLRVLSQAELMALEAAP